MFGFRSDYDQCYKRGPDLETCCCDPIYSADSLFKALPIGLMSGAMRGNGLAGLWKDKRHNSDDTQLSKWEKFKRTMRSRKELWHLFKSFIAPPAIEHVAEFFFPDLDGRLVNSFGTIFTFLTTLAIAIYLHPYGHTHNPDKKVSLQMFALVCIGGSILTYGHMPYEEKTHINDFMDFILRPEVITFIVIGIVMLFATWVATYQERYPLNAKLSAFLHAILLLSANTLAHICVEFFLFFLYFLYTGQEVIVNSVVFSAAAVGALFLFFVSKAFKFFLYFRDPVYMMTIMCGLDVLGNALWVTVVYFDAFSCAITDILQFIFGCVGVVLGLTGLALNNDII